MRLSIRPLPSVLNIHFFPWLLQDPVPEYAAKQRVRLGLASVSVRGTLHPHGGPIHPPALASSKPHGFMT